MPSAGTQTPTPTPGSQASAAQPSSAPEGSAGPATPSASGAPASSAAATPRPSGLPSELAVSGSLSVCTAQVGAPATTTNPDGQLDGYNIAFANEIAARLGLQPVIQVEDFSELISMVQSHACDVSVASQNITSDRSAQVNLIPYTQSRDGFPVVVAINNPLKIRKLTDLCGQVVSAAEGTTNVDQVNGTGDFVGQGLDDQCAAGSKPELDLKTFASEADAVQALLDGTVVAYLGNSNFVAEYPDEIQTSSATLPGTHQGMGVALDHPNLTAGIEAALSAMITDGAYLQNSGSVPVARVSDQLQHRGRA